LHASRAGSAVAPCRRDARLAGQAEVPAPRRDRRVGRVPGANRSPIRAYRAPAFAREQAPEPPLHRSCSGRNPAAACRASARRDVVPLGGSAIATAVGGRAHRLAGTLVAGDGLAHRHPSRSWKRIEALVLGDVIARSSRHPRARMRSMTAPYSDRARPPCRRSGRTATGGSTGRASPPSPTPSCATQTVARVRSRRPRSAVPRRRSTAEPAGAARRGRPPRGAARPAAGHRGRRAVRAPDPARHRISRRYRGAEGVMRNAA
jgi:hypothetical protein